MKYADTGTFANAIHSRLSGIERELTEFLRQLSEPIEPKLLEAHSFVKHGLAAISDALKNLRRSDK